MSQWKITWNKILICRSRSFYSTSERHHRCSRIKSHFMVHFFTQHATHIAACITMLDSLTHFQRSFVSTILAEGEDLTHGSALLESLKTLINYATRLMNILDLFIVLMAFIVLMIHFDSPCRIIALNHFRLVHGASKNWLMELFNILSACQ